MEVGGDFEADRLCHLWYLFGHFFRHDKGSWGRFGSSATGRAGGNTTKCNGAGSGGLMVADRTRTVVSGRHAAGTGQASGEQTAHSGDTARAVASRKRAAGTGQGGAWRADRCGKESGSSIRKLRKQVIA